MIFHRRIENVPDFHFRNLVAPNVAPGTTLHTSVWFQRCYGCYAINPLEGSDCRFTNERHRQCKHDICRDDFALRHPKSAKQCAKSVRWHVTPLTNQQIISSKCC